MTLPTFLGIGAQRSGTTWLDSQLRTHSQVYLPTRRKEVHFFDKYFDRGVAWYRNFFPGKQNASRFRAIGEITPKYLYSADAPARIHKLLPGCKLIVILRNPVDRAFSQYGLSVKKHGERRTFEEFCEERPDVFARGLYSQQMERYLRHFPREQIFVLIFERAVCRDQASALRQIAGFLGIDPTGFETAASHRRHGESFLPRFPRASSAATRLSSILRDKNLDWAVNLAKAAGIPKLFGRRDELPPMRANTRDSLLQRYQPDVAALEKLLGEDLSIWYESADSGQPSDVSMTAARAAANGGFESHHEAA